MVKKVKDLEVLNKQELTKEYLKSKEIMVYVEEFRFFFDYLY